MVSKGSLEEHKCYVMNCLKRSDDENFASNLRLDDEKFRFDDEGAHEKLRLDDEGAHQFFEDTTVENDKM